VATFSLTHKAYSPILLNRKSEFLSFILFTFEHEQFEEVDHFVLNEAELTLSPFLADLNQGCAKRVYKTSEFSDIQQTPVPRWELAEVKRYASMSIQFSRGCPFDCDFCNVTALLGHRPRVKATEQIIAELDSLYDLGWRGQVFVVDDNFIGNKRFLKTRLLPALIEWRKDKKGIPYKNRDLVENVRRIQRAGLQVQGGFIV